MPSSTSPGSALLVTPERWGWIDLALIRGVFIAITTVASYYLRPFPLPKLYSALLGASFGLAIVLFEMRLRRVSLKRLIGAAVGSILGILGAFLISLVLTQTNIEARSVAFLQIAFLMLMTYVGLVLGANKGDLLNLAALGGLVGAERLPRRTLKILDTSVIIDGRIADICETGFLDGILLIPQFVLHELQLVADSGDALKRNRGRRGLDILQHIQKIHSLQVEIVEDDFPHLREVDLKLIELAKRYEAKIVTNDFNLNKLAQLQGVPVLNINELANTLKPIVLPGEMMRVFILKEGKEYNQGVAYLDDGTMVVVDNARRLIGKTIEITVTSVLQTTAGKMIFGRYEESRAHRPEVGERAAARPATQNQHTTPPSERATEPSRAERNPAPRKFSGTKQRSAPRGTDYEVISDE
ncbi:MAG: PIN/TRAM domain-containing protein [Terriglobia bacterium]